MREKVEAELDRLVQKGTFDLVDYANWAAPIAAVLKSDRKSVRVCGDFRMTVNPVSKLHRYSIPRVCYLIERESFLETSSNTSVPSTKA